MFMRKPGCIYIIRCGNSRFYKIGFSANPIERLNSLQTANPYELQFEGLFYSPSAFRIEEDIQKKYAKYKRRGEWFALSLDNLRMVSHNISIRDGVIVITDFLVGGGSYEEFLESLDPNYPDFWQKVKSDLKDRSE